MYAYRVFIWILPGDRELIGRMLPSEPKFSQKTISSTGSPLENLGKEGTETDRLLLLRMGTCTRDQTQNWRDDEDAVDAVDTMDAMEAMDTMDTVWCQPTPLDLELNQQLLKMHHRILISRKQRHLISIMKKSRLKPLNQLHCPIPTTPEDLNILVITLSPIEQLEFESWKYL